MRLVAKCLAEHPETCPASPKHVHCHCVKVSVSTLFPRSGILSSPSSSYFDPTCLSSPASFCLKLVLSPPRPIPGEPPFAPYFLCFIFGSAPLVTSRVS